MISRKVPILAKGDILLFEVENQQHNQSQLKDFLHFLKFCGKRGSIKFSHLEESGTLIKGLTLKENILLDSGLEIKRTVNLITFLEQRDRPALSRLARQVRNFNCYPSEADQETKKLTSLIKALINHNDYLFLERPSKFLSKENTTLFLDALFESMKSKDQTLLLTSENKDIWASHITRVVTRTTSGVYSLDAVLSQNEVVTNSHLEFIHSATTHKKAA